MSDDVARGLGLVPKKVEAHRADGTSYWTTRYVRPATSLASRTLARRQDARETQVKAVADVFAKNPEGFTYRPTGLREPKVGYVVSLHPDEGHGHIIEKGNFKSPAAIQGQVKDWIRAQLSTVKGKKDFYFGGFVERDKDTKRVIAYHLDVNTNFRGSEADAVALGKKNNQLSIWDVRKGAQIETGGTGRSAKKPKTP